MNVEFSTSSDKSRNHYKKHRQDEDPSDTGERPSPDATTMPTQPSSYKDTLLGDQNHINPSDEDFLDEEDIDLQEGDVTRGMEDGLVTINFSDRVHDLAVKSLEQTIVIKTLGRTVGYTTLKNKCLILLLKLPDDPQNQHLQLRPQCLGLGWLQKNDNAIRNLRKLLGEDPDSSPMMNNLADEPPKKSHDLVISASSKTVHAQESMTVDMHHDAHSVDVPARVSDAHGSTMSE
ncbi:hypothetical protein V6N11_021529 [Hibiscus sabdariffa]|uniref:Uncharacterized protein n=2 Tax=Hibiscus sabdariffa TaxID=183260 RepID=A0ABR2NI02_9ROSI